MARLVHIERVDHLPIIQPGGNSPSDKKRSKGGKSNRPSYRFVDQCRMRAVGGEGGNGSLSLHHVSRKRHVTTDGGHGGSGGSVILIADEHCTSLSRFRPHVSAEKGRHGRGKERHGARGKNAVLRVPPGVVVRRVLDDDDEWDEETKTVLRKEEPINGDDEDAVWEYDPPENESDTTDLEINEQQEDFDYDDEADGNEEDIKNHNGRFVEASLDYDTDDEDSEEFSREVERRTVTVADLDTPGAFTVVARGGRGGMGKLQLLQNILQISSK